MNRGISLLLSRMESNPEEFPLTLKNNFTSQPWGKYLEAILDKNNAMGFVSHREREELLEKYWGIQGDNFTEEVITTLFSVGGGESKRTRDDYF